MTSPDSSEDVLVSMDQGVALITLNRPDKLNALTPQMGVAYASALLRVAADPDVRVAVVTGAGRGFCSGADLSVLAQGPEALDGFVAQTSDDVLPNLALHVDIPVVMAVNAALALGERRGGARAAASPR